MLSTANERRTKIASKCSRFPLTHCQREQLDLKSLKFLEATTEFYWRILTCWQAIENCLFSSVPLWPSYGRYQSQWLAWKVILLVEEKGKDGYSCLSMTIQAESFVSIQSAMNDDWKKKYYFDENTNVTKSSMPSMPCNVSPFVKRDDYQDPKSTSKDSSKGGQKKNNCTIAWSLNLALEKWICSTAKCFSRKKK